MLNSPLPNEVNAPLQPCDAWRGAVFRGLSACTSVSPAAATETAKMG